MLRKVPMYALPLTLFAGIGLAYCLFRLTSVLGSVASNPAPKISNINCDYKYERLDGYKYISPLVLAEENCESERYASMKNEISKLLDGYTSLGTLHSSAVYFKNLKNGEWTCINSDAQFDPGSLMKVPVLMTVLRMEENHPGILNTQLKYTQPLDIERDAVFITRAIEANHVYTVKELLEYMIFYSDNNATSLLMDHIDASAFRKTFTDLGLRPLDSTAITYPISAKDYSVFMEAIYNVAYLTIPHSEYAASLLSQCDFKEGLAKGIPAGVKIVHKFGEGGDEGMHQLHESGIVYLSGNPYLLTIMTRGHELGKLPEVLRAVSNLVYTDMTRAD